MKYYRTRKKHITNKAVIHIANFTLRYYTNTIRNLSFELGHTETTEQRTYKHAQEYALMTGLSNAMKAVGDSKGKEIISIELSDIGRRYICSLLRRDPKWIQYRSTYH